MQKILFFLLFFFDCLSTNNHMVYSHGFGESNIDNSVLLFFKNLEGFCSDYSITSYPDATGNLWEAVFYTKPAVHELANHLYQKVIIEKKDSLCLVGRSCGAGIIINFLAKLITFDESQEYFKNTKITSSVDAQAIFSAINKGALIMTASFLDMHTVRSLIFSGDFLVAASFLGCLAGLHYNDSFPYKKIFSLAGAGILTRYFFGTHIKKKITAALVKIGMPLLTQYKFDPFHITPFESLDVLRNKLSCPIFLHFHEYDEVLEYENEHIIKTYDALKNGKTHVIITTDGQHSDGMSEQLAQSLHVFKTIYDDHGNNHHDRKYGGIKRWMIMTQPTVGVLRKKLETINR